MIKFSLNKFAAYLSIILFPFLSGHTQSFTFEDLEFEIISFEEETAGLKSCPAYIRELIVPEKVIYEGKEFSVTAILEEACQKNYNLVSVVLPSSLTSIENRAFGMCDALMEIELPQELQTIGEDAFWACKSLTEIIIPDSVTYIGEGAFSSCQGLVSARLPEGLESISDSLFYRCQNLKNITIPESVKKIESDAFSVCDELETINIPASVTEIGYSAFGCCSKLSNFNVSEDNPVFSTDGSMLLYNGNVLVAYPSATGDVTLPDYLTEIGACAFYGSWITSVTIPPAVTKIGKIAFCECFKLKKMTVLPVKPPVLGEQAIFVFGYDLFFPIYVPADSLYSYIWAWGLDYKNYLYPLPRELGPGASVNSIRQEDNFTVVTLDGKLILQTESSEELKNLPSGIYIINGKKVFLNNKF